MKKYFVMSLSISLGLAAAGWVYAADSLAIRAPIQEHCAGKHHAKPSSDAHFKRIEADVAAAQSAGKISAQDAQQVREKIAASKAAHLAMETQNMALQAKLDALGLKPALARRHDLMRHLEHISQDVDQAEKSGQLSASDAKNVRQQILSLRTEVQQTEAAGNPTQPNPHIQAQMQALHQQLKQLKLRPTRPPRAAL